jgi:hypothetical protein
MTLAEAFREFDRVEPAADPDWQTIEGDRVGTPYDCDVPVILDSHDGTAKLRCCVCGFEIAEITPQCWVITAWGGRGIRLPRITRGENG